MSQPPQILRIKRKRGDDPVESLYYDPQQSATKRRVTTSGAELVFKRIVGEPPPIFSPQRTSNGIPHVIATRPGEEKDYIQRRQRLNDVANRESKPTAQSSATLPRRFYLSRTTVSAPATASVGKKNRTLHGQTDVAVFEEDHANLDLPSALDPSDAMDLNASNSSHAGLQILNPTPSPKKRPRTPATGSRPLTPLRQSNEETTSATHEALQRYAAEELGPPQPSQEPTQAHNSSQHFSDGSAQDGDAMDTSPDQPEASHDDEAGYIYDTYMRYANALQNLPNKFERDPLDGTNPKPGTTSISPDAGSIGYIVIPEADQTLWETFYLSDESSSSDGDWDSEEDDENHENYYGADYPEDEVSSEDDRDENPYRYRTGSGDDEWGSEDEALSDEDGRRPWLVHASGEEG